MERQQAGVESSPVCARLRGAARWNALTTITVVREDPAGVRNPLGVRQWVKSASPGDSQPSGTSVGGRRLYQIRQLADCQRMVRADLAERYRFSGS